MAHLSHALPPASSTPAVKRVGRTGRGERRYRAAVTIRAVIFDLGGVVFPSPLPGFRSYEAQMGLREGFISEAAMAAGGDLWPRFETSQLSPEEFSVLFEAACAQLGGEIVVADLLDEVYRVVGEPRAEMVAALEALRGHGFLTGALTNSWMKHGEPAGRRFPNPAERLPHLFDAIVESAVVGLRKPDPRIYALVLEQLDVDPGETVFLDDFGKNIIAAQELGMNTVKVEDSHSAIAELAELLAVSL
ncbi:MAG: HAD family phosphatase [Deltaproteobacteria bacterium]